MRAVVQSADYYPYREPWREPSGQPFLYGGKERLRVDGLNEYDFNARRLIPALGIFAVFDDAAEKNPEMSPYLYCSGNPVNRIDPTGMTDFEVEDKIKTIEDGHNNRFMTVSLEQFEQLLSAFNDGTYDAVFNDIAKIVGYVDYSMFLDDESNTGYGYEFEFLKVPTKNGTHFTLDNLETIVSTYEIGNGAKTELFEMASKDALKGTPNQSLKGTQAVRAAMGKEVGAYFRIAKGIGYAGCIVTGINSISTCINYYGNYGGSGAGVAVKAGLDFAMSILGTIGGPIGFAISTTYFILDGSTDLFGVLSQ